MDLYVMNADGSNKRDVTNVTNYTTQPCLPQWSPDKSKIAYTDCGSGSTSPVLVINADGTGLANLNAPGNIPGTYIRWSPDGTKILCENTNGGPMYVLPVAGGTPVTLGSGVTGTSPNWSPSGATIVFAGTDGVSTGICDISSTGTGFAALANNQYARSPVYSPDGSKIFYWSQLSTSVPATLMSMNNDGSSPATLATISAGGIYNPVLSPDGTKLAFSYEGSGPSIDYVINSDGTNLTQLSTLVSPTSVDQLHWSSDSQYIILMDMNDVIEKVKADGTGPVTLTQSGLMTLPGDWISSH